MKSWVKDIANRLHSVKEFSVDGHRYVTVLAKTKEGETSEYTNDRVASLISTYVLRDPDLQVKYRGVYQWDRLDKLTYEPKNNSRTEQRKMYVMLDDVIKHCKSGEPDGAYVKELRGLGGKVTEERTKYFLNALEIDGVSPDRKTTDNKKTNGENVTSSVSVAEKQEIPFEVILIAAALIIWLLWEE